MGQYRRCALHWWSRPPQPLFAGKIAGGQVRHSPGTCTEYRSSRHRGRDRHLPARCLRRLLYEQKALALLDHAYVSYLGRRARQPTRRIGERGGEFGVSVVPSATANNRRYAIPPKSVFERAVNRIYSAVLTWQIVASAARTPN